MFSKFPLILKELRESNGYSRKYLADKLEISVSLLAKWESTNPDDKRDPGTINLVRLSEIFGVTTDYLLGRSDIPLNPSEADILNDIDKTLLQLLETYGIPIGDERYSLEEIEAIVKMIKNIKSLI
jgi:transcriptional regulator with XRE-family HTH domain